MSVGGGTGGLVGDEESSSGEARPRLCVALRDNATELVLLLDRQLCCADYNAPFVTALQSARGRGPVRGEHVRGMVGERVWKEVGPQLERALDGEASMGEHAVPMQSGRDRPLEGSFNPARAATGEIEGVIVILRDATARRRHEASLARSLESRRALIDALPDAITTLRRDGTITDFKPERTIPTPMAREQLLGRHLSTFPHVPAQEILHHLADAFATGTTVTFEYEAKVNGVTRAREGRIRAINEDEALLLVRDLTEQRALMSRLLAADRMASIGTLAAGVAHELNNPLAYVMSNLRTIRDEVEDLSRPDLVELLRTAERGAEQMRHIVRDLKAFTRQGQADGSSFDATKVLRRAIGLAEHTVRSVAELDVNVRGPLLVRMNEVRLGQVIVNLLLNAAHSFDGVEANRPRHIDVRAFREGEKVVIEVEDSGAGIAHENLSRIFEPFFTTKAAGGTGLGLSISRDIVRHAGGDIVVESTIGSGSVFRVALPHAHATQPPRDTSTNPPRPRILLVDDQDAVRVGLTASLRRIADVESAASGKEALAIFERVGSFDLVLCDYWMPEMGGVETLARIQEIESTQRVALMSGADLSEIDRQRVEREGWAFVEKPFTREEIAGLLHITPTPAEK